MFAIIHIRILPQWKFDVSIVYVIVIAADKLTYALCKNICVLVFVFIVLFCLYMMQNVLFRYAHLWFDTFLFKASKPMQILSNSFPKFIFKRYVNDWFINHFATWWMSVGISGIDGLFSSFCSVSWWNSLFRVIGIQI